MTAKHVFAATLGLFVLLSFKQPAVAEQRLSIEAGIPLPLVIHGSSIRYSGEPAPLGTGAIGYDLSITPHVWLTFRGRLSFNKARNSLGSRIVYSTTSAGLGWSTSLSKALGIDLFLSAAASLLYASLRIDDNIGLKTVSAGLQINAAIEKRLRSNWSLGLNIGLDEYLAPFNKEIWFNRRLGRTRFMTVGFGLAKRF